MLAGERILTRHRSWNASLRLRFRNAEPKWRADNLVQRKQFNHEPAERKLDYRYSSTRRSPASRQIVDRCTRNTSAISD
jgi:hypothetical protein